MSGQPKNEVLSGAARPPLAGGAGEISAAARLQATHVGGAREILRLEKLGYIPKEIADTVRHVASGPLLAGNITGSMGDARDGMCVTDSNEKPAEEAAAEVALSEIQIEAKMELFQRSLMDETCPPHSPSHPEKYVWIQKENGAARKEGPEEDIQGPRKSRGDRGGGRVGNSERFS